MLYVESVYAIRAQHNNDKCIFHILIRHEERYLSLKNKADNGGKKNENRRREKSNNEDKSNNAFNMQKIDYNAYQPTIETENKYVIINNNQYVYII